MLRRQNVKSAGGQVTGNQGLQTDQDRRYLGNALKTPEGRRARSSGRRRALLAVAIALAAVLAASVLVPMLAWPDGFPPWGHPGDEETLVGVWEGSYDTGSGRLLVNKDHTFTLEIRVSSAGPGESDGTWTYSDGVLRLSPALDIVYDTSIRQSRYEELSSLAFDVKNTILPWRPRITQGERVLLFKK